MSRPKLVPHAESQTPEPLVLPSQLDQTEQQLLEQLVTEAEMAQALAQKLTNRLAAKYQLQQGDALDYKTGTITRKASA